MKHDWEYKKLGDLSLEKLSYGSGASAIDYDNNIRYVRITDITDDGVLNDDAKSPSTFDEKYLLNEGDLLFARSGATVGKTYLHSTCNGTCIYAGYLIRFVPNKNIVYPPYVFLYTKSNIYKSFVKKAQNAVAQPNINAQQYGNLSIPVPPLPTQQSIVSELDSLSQIIADCKETLKDYDALEQSIFYDMFGDPVKNDKGWDMKKLEDCCLKIGSGATPKGGDSAYKEEGISLIRSLNVHNDGFRYKDLAFIDEDQAKALSNVQIEPLDVLLNITGASVARCCIVPNDVIPARVNQHVSILRCNQDVIAPTFLSFQLKSAEYQTVLLTISRSNGATREALTKQQQQNFDVILPPLPLQQQFASKIEAIEKMKSETKKALQEAETLFNARMDYWFN